MSIELKKHNAEAYEKVVQAFNSDNKTAVIHPTGTGKSYIALKLIEENPNKRVLYLAPWNPILYQLKENIIASEGKMFKNLKRMTYQKLSSLSAEDLKNLNVDIIVLDEFHHCGSPVWGKAVQELIDNNINANVLGLSATPIRYFDGNIDMAEKLFGNNVASEMSFEEAIEQGILPSFDYVSSIYGYEASLEKLKKDEFESIPEDKSDEVNKLYSELKENLEKNTSQLSAILDKYMVNKNGKYIVYCRNIEDLERKVNEAKELFSSVNPNIQIFKVSSLDNRKVTKEELEQFKNADSMDTLKLMFSVNMLNEGYHLPDIDGVIMMRPTMSPTIYQQQMGRALTVGNKGDKRPVIIDLVDNFDSIQIIEDFYEKMKQYVSSNGNKGNAEGSNKTKIQVYDYTENINKIIRKIEYLTSREKIALKVDRLKEFCENNPVLWISGCDFLDNIEDKSERKNLEEQLEHALADYSYIANRDSRGKLSDEHVEILREAGVGRKFGYKKEIEDIASRYSYDDTKDFKKFLYCACAEYGSLDNFKQHYIQALISGGDDKYNVGNALNRYVNNVKDLDKYFITNFDISSPNFQSEGNKGYELIWEELKEKLEHKRSNI